MGRKKTRKIETLYDLQPGDEVLLTSRHNAYIVIVEKVTPTIVVCNGAKFRKASGLVMPYTPWNNSYIQVLTPELRQAYLYNQQKKEYIQSIRQANLDELPMNIITQIHQLIKK